MTFELLVFSLIPDSLSQKADVNCILNYSSVWNFKSKHLLLVDILTLNRRFALLFRMFGAHLMFCLADVECDEILRPPSGVDSQLPAEDPGSFVQLPFVRPPNADVSTFFFLRFSFSSSCLCFVSVSRSRDRRSVMGSVDA